MESKRHGHWLGMSLVVMLLMGCEPDLVGSGNLIEEERRTPDFSAVILEDGIGATIVVDPSQPKRVRLIGDDNLVERLRTEVPAGADALRVYFPREEVDGWSSDNPLRAEVTVPELRQLQAMEGSTVDLSGTLSSQSFSLEASGGSRVRAREFEAESLDLVLSGGSEVTPEGYAQRVRTSLSGGSKLLARGLSTREASMLSSGGSTNVLQVSDLLTVEASGGSTVAIIGRPTVRSELLSGGSTLRFE